MSAAGVLAAGALGALGAGLAMPSLGALVRHERWTRTNHAGRSVTLLEGPAWMVGATAGALVAGPAGVAAVLGAGAFGALDDLAGDGSSKGLKGHLGAAARGEVTTGAVKILGIGLTGVLAAVLVDRPRRVVPFVDTLVAGAVVAGAANLANLLDLRPGRALKATVLVAAPLVLLGHGSRASATLAAAAIGASVGVLHQDLAGRAMLGDTGANAAGALVGTALVAASGRRGRWAALVVLTGLTLASERVSFTTVIESTPVLRELDAWGRALR